MSQRVPHVLLALACALSSCTREPEPPPEPTELETRAETPDAPAPRPIDPAASGAVRGRVRFAGEPPPRRAIPMVPECGAPDGQVVLEDVVTDPDGGLAWVLVHVRRGLAGYAVPSSGTGAAAELDQAGCRYAPRVVLLRAGGVLRVTNSDRLTHNVRVRAPRNGVHVNRTQAAGEPAIEVALDRPELKVEVACDLHPWMGAVVHVLDHPFHALTGADGAFRIEGLPAGEHELEALHPTLGRRRATVRVEPGGEAVVELAFEGR